MGLEGARRTARQVGRGATRELPGDDPRPRPHHLSRGRRQARRHGHRAEGQDVRQPGRPAVDHRPGHPDDALRARAVRPVQDPERLLRGHRRLHQHGVRRRVPGRRSTRGDLRAGTGHGPRGRRAGHRPGGDPAAQLPAERTSSRTPTRRASSGVRNGAEVFIDSGDYEPALDRALEMVGYVDIATRKAEAKRRGKLLGVGLSTYIEICGVAPSKWIGAVGEGWGAAMWESANIRVHLTGKVVLTIGTQPQGQGHETTYVADRRLAAGHRCRRRHRPAFGYPGHPVRIRLVRQPNGGRRRYGGHQGGREDQGQGQDARRAHAGSLARRHRGRRRELPGQGLARQGQDARGDRLRHRPRLQPARGYGAVSRRDGLLRHTQLHLAVRHPHRHGRGRRADGRGRPGALHRRRRRRQQDQPADRRGPDPRRSSRRASARRSGRAPCTTRTASCCRARCSTTPCPRPRGSRPSSWTRRSRPSPVNPLGVKGVGEAGAIAIDAGGGERGRSTPCAGFGIRHIDMPLTRQKVWRAMQSAKGGQA